MLALTFTAACGDERPPGGSPYPEETSPSPPGGTHSAKPGQSPTPPRYAATIERITSRSSVPHSWRPGCPVPLSGLRRIRMSYWGFDDKPHTGTLIANAESAEDLIGVFRKLYDRRFPIRRMEPVDKYKGSDFDSIEANNTSAFNCRRATGSDSWSEHAYGNAIDLNPCENPYVTASGGVAHKDCVKYRNRRLRVPGMVHEGDRVVDAFSDIGWSWGGVWTGARDYQHFSRSGS
jgi:hypothetical protein